MKNKKALVFVLVGLVLIFWAGWVIFKEIISNNLEVVFFDVGQGDSAFIETPDKFQVLIDGGPDLTVLDKLGKEMPFYDRTINLIVLTHTDYDHLFGLLEVLKRYEIKNILWTGIADSTDNYKEWLRLIKEEGANIIIAEAGQKIVLQKEPLIYLDIIYPFERLENKETEVSNDASVVLKLVSEEKTFLFTGDIPQKIEKQLTDIRADILKISHHGSKNSSSAEFLEAVGPKTAVISVGENKWGHPSPETLQRLKQSGINVLITKEAGDIKL